MTHMFETCVESNASVDLIKYPDHCEFASEWYMVFVYDA